jgi:sarcosine oxidase subunit gamma
MLSLSSFHGAKPQLDAALNIVLPEHPVFVTRDAITYIWSGPGSWLALGAGMADLAAAKRYASITDQSDGKAVFEVSGPHAQSALAMLIPIDLRDNIFPAGATALTLAGHINVQIWRAAGNRFSLACFRSFANALYQALATTCREFES